MSIAVIAGVDYKDISKHLKCSLCGQLIRTPKLLPCLHSFCQTCIQDRTEPTQKGFSCPDCETEVGFTRAESEKLQTNFFIDNMLDIALIKSDETNPVLCTSCDIKIKATSRCVDCGEFLCENCYGVHKRIRQTKEHQILTIQELLANKTGEVLHRPAYCNSHPSETLRYFCDNCNEPLCRDCLIIEHRQHKYDFIHDSKKVQKQKDSLAKLLELTKEDIPVLEKSLKDIRNVSDRLHGRLAEVKRLVRETTENHIKILREREEQLLFEADKIHEKKSTALKNQLIELERHHLRLNFACDFTIQVLKYSNEVEFMSVKNEITERLKELKATQLVLKPRENGHLNYILDRKYAEKAVALSLGCLNSSGSLVFETAGLVNGNLNGESTTRTPGDEQDTKQVPLSVDLKSSSGIYVSPIIQQDDNLKCAVFNPTISGTYQLNVYYNGQTLDGFPVYLGIGDLGPRLGSPKKSFGGNGTQIGKLSDPRGVACDPSGRVIVSDSRNHRIQVFNTEGKFQYGFGSFGTQEGQLQSPNGVAVDNNANIYVADTMNNRIQVFTTEGNFLKTFPSSQNTNCLNQPSGVAIDNRGRVVVVDRDNARIVIFNSNGSIATTFGTIGNGKAQFNCPTGVAVNSLGHIAVTDFGNDRIQLFGSDGSFLFKFGKSGRGDGELNWPTGIAFSQENNIFVCDSFNHRIQIFKSDGTYLNKFGSEGSLRGQFKRPEGVVILNDGEVVVADWGNDRIQIF